MRGNDGRAELISSPARARRLHGWHRRWSQSCHEEELAMTQQETAELFRRETAQKALMAEARSSSLRLPFPPLN